MWQSLIEILLSKYLQPKTRKELAARAFVSLYEAMLCCHTEYKRFVADKSDENFFAWQLSIRRLISELSPLRYPLEVFSPSTFDEVLDYAMSECCYLNTFGDRLTRSTPWWKLWSLGVDEETRLMDAVKELERITDGPKRTLHSDFQTALERLRKFITSNFSVHEIYRCQKCFPK